MYSAMDCLRLSALVIFCILALGPESKASRSALILTPYVNRGEVDNAKRLSLVDPGLFLNITSYSGFLTVDEKYNSNLFYWYFPAAGKPKNNPWIIWLQGGPGGSSLSGVFDEMGPFSYNHAARRLELREHSWCKDYSMVFIDSPVGAGYSFTNSNAGFPDNLSTVSYHLMIALKQLVEIYPEMKEAPLYIAGESYAGYYVPMLAIDYYLNPLNLTINLKGLILGNPVMDRASIANYSALFYQWGLIDTQGLLAAKPLQDKYIESIKANNTIEAYEGREKLIDMLTKLAAKEEIFSALKDSYNFQDYVNFLIIPEVKDALHVGNIAFTFSNHSVADHLRSEFLTDINEHIGSLLEQYKILIYCGQLDLTSACAPNAETRRHKWHWEGREAFLNAARTPWWYNNTVAGYVKSDGNFTEVLVSNAGHLVPYEKPAEVHQIISYFIRGLEFPLPTNHHEKDYTGYLPKLPENDYTQSSTQASTKIVTEVSVSTKSVTEMSVSTKSVTEAKVTEKPQEIVTEKEPIVIVTTSKGSIAVMVLSILGNIALFGALVVVYNRYRRRSEGIRNNLWSYDNLHESLESGM